MPVRSVTVRVPAKVNLQLSVGPREADGYHNLATVFQAVSIYDEITVSLRDVGHGISLEVVGEFTHLVHTDGTNLAVRAIEILSDNFDLDVNAHITINKSIPVAGGMAGGSADAAAVLLAIDYLFDLGLSKDSLETFAAQLGSDVPFMLMGHTAVGTGHGDQLTPALSRGTYHWVFALSTVGLSTPAVYTECDRMRAGLDIAQPQASDALLQALLADNPVAVGKALSNDLQSAACSLRPALSLILDVGDDFGALGAIVSGSGPTVAFLVRDEEQGLDLAVALTASGVVGSVARAYGPVAGAKIIESH